MSGTIDTRTVEMRFDNKHFESNVKQSMSTLEKLKKSLKLDGASKGLEEVERKSKKLDFKDLDRNIDGIGKKFSALETIATGVFLKIGMSAAEAGMKIVKSFTIDQVSAGFNKYGRMTSGVQMIMANLRDDTGKWLNEFEKMEYVNEQIQRLLTFTDETSYRFTDMMNNAGKWISSGVGLEDTVKAMEGIATMSAMAGQNPEQAQVIYDSFTRAIQRGYVGARDWYSLQKVMTVEAKEQAIAIGEELGLIKKGTVTVENFRESFLLKKGQKSSWFNKDVMIKLFDVYGSGANKMIDYMNEAGVSGSEALKHLAETDKEFANSLGYKALRYAQEAKTFGEAMDATADAVSTKWAQIFNSIFGDYLEAKKLWTDFSEDLWNIFAAPLDNLNEIMVLWKRGFKLGPLNPIDRAFENGILDDIDNIYSYVTQEAAELAVASDSAKYRIETLADGSKQLVKLVKNSSGSYSRFIKRIYDEDKNLLSGRKLLLDGAKNILQAFFLGWEEEINGKVVKHLSLLESIKQAFLEVFFPKLANAEDGGRKSIAKWLVELTKKFHDFTEKLKPLGDKLKNIFKGFFTVFKIIGNFIKAIIKPFKRLFSKILGTASDDLLSFTDSIATWIQKFDKFLQKNKIYEKVSSGVSSAIHSIIDAINQLSKILTGLSLSDLFKKIKKDVVDFFVNFDFKNSFGKIKNFFVKIITQIKDVETDKLPEKLTPLQNFWLGLKNIFNAIKKAFAVLSVPFKKIAEFINKFFTGIAESLSNRNNEKAVSRFKPIWEGIKKFFKGIGDFFEKIGPTLEKIGEWLGEKLSAVGDAIVEFGKNHDVKETIEWILKGGFLASLSTFFFSLSSVFGGTGGILKSIKKDLDAVRGVLKSYQREINASTILEIAMAIGILAGAMWILAQIPSDKLEGAGKALAIIAGSVAGFSLLKDVFKIFSNLSNKTGKGVTQKATEGVFANIKGILTGVVGASIFANDSTAKFVKICLGILLAALAMKAVVNAMLKIGDVFIKLADIPPSKIERGGKAIAQIFLAFGAFALLAGTANKASSALFAALAAYVLIAAIKKFINLLAELGGDEEKMKNIRAAIDKFKDVFKAVGEIVSLVIKIGLVIAVAQLLISAFASFAKTNAIGVAQAIKQFGKNFLRIALSLVVVAAAFAILVGIIKSNKPADIDAASSFLKWMLIPIGIMVTAVAGFTMFGKRTGKHAADILKQFGNSFIKIAASLIIIAVALGIVTNIAKNNPDYFSMASGILIAMLAIMATALTIIVGFESFGKRTNKNTAEIMRQIGNVFIKIATSLIIIAAAFAIFSLFKFNNAPIEVIAAILGGFLVIVTAIAMISSKWLKNKTARDGVNAMVKFMLQVASALAIVALVFGLFSLIPFNNKSVGIIAAILGGFLVIATLMAVVSSRLLKSKTSRDGITAISIFVVMLAASLLLLSTAFSAMAGINFDKNSMWSIAAIFGLFLVVAGAIALLAGALIKEATTWAGIIAIAGVLVAAAFSLLIVARAIEIVAKSTTPKKIESFVNIVLAFGIFTAVMAAIGIAAGASEIGLLGFVGIAVLMAVAAGSLLVVAIAIRQMSNSLTEKQVDQAIRIITAVGLLIGILSVIGIIAGVSVVGAAGILTVAALIISIGVACLLVGKGVSMAIDAFTNFVDAFSKFVDVISSKGPSFVENIKSVINGLLQAVIDSGPKIKEAIKSVVNGIYEGVSESIDKISSIAGMLIGAFATGMIESAYKISYASVMILLMTVKGILDALASLAGPLVKSFVLFISSLADAINDNIDDFIEAGKKLGEALLNGIKKILSEGWSAILKFLVGEENAAWLTGTSKKPTAKKSEDSDLSTSSEKGLLRSMRSGSNTTEDIKEAGAKDGTNYAESFMDGVKAAFGETSLSSLFPEGMNLGSLIGTTDFASLFTGDFSAESISKNFLSPLTDGLDLSSITGGSGPASAYIQSILDSKDDANAASTELAKTVEEPFASLDWKKWGEEGVDNYVTGMLSKSDAVNTASNKIATIVWSFFHHSHPEKGPLADDYKWAPDMIKLWCSGIYNNLHLVDKGSDAMASRIDDGFGTALDYVSSLIDEGMSDELTIRPIMDLSEIQNGTEQLESMLNNRSDYSLQGTANLTSLTAKDMRGFESSNNKVAADQQISAGTSDTFNNTFNITNNDPNAVADKVSRIIQRQINRKQAIWAK